MRLAVQNSHELRRILALPRRSWDYDKEGERIATEVTKHITLPGHRCARGGCAVLNGNAVTRLRPWQAVSLAELHDYGGTYCQAGVGDGKTLPSMLAAPMLCADRTLLVVPAALRDDTWRKFKVLQEHWQYLPMMVVSYDFLSNAKNKDYLWKFFRGAARPLLVLDECHEAKNIEQSARARRIHDFVSEWRENESRTGYQTLSVLDMSGTAVNRSVRDCAPMLWWARPTMCPLPTEPSDLYQWSGALDEKVKAEERFELGALEVFGENDAMAGDWVSTEGGMSQDVMAAVRGLAKRIFDTPGVIAAPAVEVSASLYVELVDLHLGESTDAAYAGLRKVDECETPDGWPVTDEVERWRHCRELSQDFFYTWDPKPPAVWMLKRKALMKEVRDLISRGGGAKKIYSKLQAFHDIQEAIHGRRCPTCKRRTTLEVCEGLEWRMSDVVDDDEEPDAPAGYVGVPTHAPCDTTPSPIKHPLEREYLEWLEVKDTFKPNTVPVWVGSTVLDYCAKWAKEAPGIIWTSHRALGAELAKRTGLPFYANGGLDQRKRPIESADPKDGSIIASIQSNHQGRNLQAWDRGLITLCPPTGKKVQQLIGRLHRPGQRADVVRFQILCPCREALEGFEQAKKDCTWAAGMQQSTSKLQLADIIEPHWRRRGLAWATPARGKEKKAQIRDALEALRPSAR